VHENPRPSRAALAAAAGRTIPDVAVPGLRVLFCGINPGLYSAATGCHFARPGNRFWPALYRSAFTPRLFRPDEQGLLPEYGLGITNLVGRATATAAEVSQSELISGARALSAKAAALRPRWLAIAGLTAYRTAFGRPDAVAGRQAESAGPAGIWLLPNPSGLNAHWTPDTLAAEFARLRDAAAAGADCQTALAVPAGALTTEDDEPSA
jgi:double-stranded uracil-DNA glycosylase